MATRKKTGKKAPARKKTTKKAASKKAAKKKVVKKGKSKMDLAVPIVERMFQKYCDGDISRKDIIAELVKKAGLTPAGAATYFQNIKNQILEDESN